MSGREIIEKENTFINMNSFSSRYQIILKYVLKLFKNFETSKKSVW